MTDIKWAVRQLKAVERALAYAGYNDAALAVSSIDLERTGKMGLLKGLLGKKVEVIYTDEMGWSVYVDDEPVLGQLKRDILDDIAYDDALRAFRSRGNLIQFTTKLVIRQE